MKKQEILRLKNIEHLAWHLLDNSEERVVADEIVVTRADYEALAALFTEDHP